MMLILFIFLPIYDTEEVGRRLRLAIAGNYKGLSQRYYSIVSWERLLFHPREKSCWDLIAESVQGLT
jgi:hypothetical protein